MNFPKTFYFAVLWLVTIGLGRAADSIDDIATQCAAYAKGIANSKFVYAVEEVSNKRTVWETDTTTISIPRLRLLRERFYSPQYGTTVEFTFDGTTMQALPRQGLLLFGRDLAKFKYRYDLQDAPLEPVRFVFSRSQSLHLPAELLDPATWQDFRAHARLEPAPDGAPPAVLYTAEASPTAKVEFRIEDIAPDRPPGKWSTLASDLQGTCEVRSWKIVDGHLRVPKEIVQTVTIGGRLDRTITYRLKSFEKLNVDVLAADTFQISSADAQESYDVDLAKTPQK